MPEGDCRENQGETGGLRGFAEAESPDFGEGGAAAFCQRLAARLAIERIGDSEHLYKIMI